MIPMHSVNTCGVPALCEAPSGHWGYSNKAHGIPVLVELILGEGGKRVKRKPGHMQVYFFLEVPVIALWTNLQSLMDSQLLENLPGTLWLVAS